jgi:hypothetical protein
MISDEQTPNIEVEEEIATTDIDAVEAAEQEEDTRPIKGAPAAEKLLQLVAEAAPPAREFGVQDHEVHLEIYGPITEKFLQHCLENEMTVDEVDYAVGMFLTFSQLSSDLIMTSLQETMSRAERKLISQTLELEETIVRKKDLTLQQWDDIIKLHTTQ